MADFHPIQFFIMAAVDFDVARKLFKMGELYYNTLCFHCQQAAEKLLKGFLLSKNNIKIPRTHDLLELLKLCEIYDNSFKDIHDQCYRLNDYAVAPRYSFNSIEESFVRQALIDVNTLLNFSPIISTIDKLKFDYESKYDYKESKTYTEWKNYYDLRYNITSSSTNGDNGDDKN